MLRTSLAKKRAKTPVKESPKTPTRSDKKSNARAFTFQNNSSDKKKAKQPLTPESSSDSDSDNDGEFEVEAILGRKVNREGKVFYRIKWKGFDLRYATWEPMENVSNAPKLIENYEKSLKAGGNDGKGERSRRQPRDVLRKRGLDELAGGKKNTTRKNNSRRKMTESEEEEEEEEEENFYDEGTDEEEAEDQESEEEVEQEVQEESSEDEEETEYEAAGEEKGGRKGKKASAVNTAPRKGAKKLKTEAVSAVPVKEISKEKKDKGKPEATSVPIVQETQQKKKQVGKLKIPEEIDEPRAFAQQQKEMQIEEPQEEVKEAQEEKAFAPMEITRLPMLEENQEKASIPSKKNSLVTEPIAPSQQIPITEAIISNSIQPVEQADPEVIKSMIIEEESPEKSLDNQQAIGETRSASLLTAAPTKSTKEDSDHATNVLRELGRTSSAFKINVEAKSDFNNLLLTRNNSGFQQTGSAFQTAKTTIVPTQKDKPVNIDVTPINPNPNSTNPLLGLLNNKDSSANALSLPFGGSPLLNNPLLYGMNMGNNRQLEDEETARKNQIVFQGYLQISNYMLPQNNPMALNNNRMRNMLGGNLGGFPMNPLHHPFLPNSANFPNYFGMANPLLGANPLFPGLPGAMGMPPMPNYFNPMSLAGANMPRNNMMFNEMMSKSGLSPTSSLAMLQGLQGGTGALTPSGVGKSDGKNKGSKDIIILDENQKDGGADGKKKEVSGEKK